MSGSGQGNWGPPPGGGFPPGGGGYPPGGGGFPPSGGGGFPPGGGGFPPGGGGFGQPPGGGFPPGGGGFGQPPGGGGFGQPPGGGFPPGGGGYGQPPGGAFPPPGGPSFGQQQGPWGPPPPKKSNAGVIALVIGGVSALCCVAGILGYQHDQKTQATFGALTAACEGRPVVGARAYVPGPGVHRIVGADPSGNTWRISNSRIPSEQEPVGVADTEVVACFGAETSVPLGNCEFYSTRYGVRVPGSLRTYPRSQKYLAVRLVAAATGQTITTATIPGAQPQQCSENIGRPTSSQFQGSAPGSTQLGPWFTATLANGATGMVPLGP